MNYLPNGIVTFNSIFELYNDLFMEIGLGIGRADSYLYDQDAPDYKPIMFKEKYIKASVNPNMPLYAGRNDIVFDPQRNYGLMAALFGFYLDKCQHSDDGDLLQGYIAHFVDDDEAKEKQRVTLRTNGRGDISSMFYYNIYLAYIDCIFRIAGYNPDLRNFDIKEEIK